MKQSVCQPKKYIQNVPKWTNLKCQCHVYFIFIFYIYQLHKVFPITCILFQVSVCEPDLPPCSFSIFMFMKNSISFVVWKKETPNNNPAIPPTSAIIERPVTRYVSVLEYLRAINICIY